MLSLVCLLSNLNVSLINFGTVCLVSLPISNRPGEKSYFFSRLFPSSTFVQNSHFTGQDMIGESKRRRQSDRWTPRQDPREPTINLSEDGTFLLCPQAKNLGPSVLSRLSAGTKKLYSAPNTFKFYPHSTSTQRTRVEA